MNLHCMRTFTFQNVPGIFSAGLDIMEFFNSKERLGEFWRVFQEVWIRLYGLNTPVIAAINVRIRVNCLQGCEMHWLFTCTGKLWKSFCKCTDCCVKWAVIHLAGTRSGRRLSALVGKRLQDNGSRKVHDRSQRNTIGESFTQSAHYETEENVYFVAPPMQGGCVSVHTLVSADSDAKGPEEEEGSLCWGRCCRKLC